MRWPWSDDDVVHAVNDGNICGCEDCEDHGDGGDGNTDNDDDPDGDGVIGCTAKRDELIAGV